jgi:hypothetical protein
MGGGRREKVSNSRRETERVKSWSCLERKQAAPPSALLLVHEERIAAQAFFDSTKHAITAFPRL